MAEAHDWHRRTHLGATLAEGRQQLRRYCFSHYRTAARDSDSPKEDSPVIGLKYAEVTTLVWVNTASSHGAVLAASLPTAALPLGSAAPAAGRGMAGGWRYGRTG